MGTNLKQEIEKTGAEFASELEKAVDLESVEALRIAYMGRKGRIIEI